MQHLNKTMLARYGIPEHIPTAVVAAQFGAGEALLGVVDRVIDEIAPGALGIACATADERRADLLRGQDGLYTLLERGYVGDAPVDREVVVQSILQVVDEDSLEALASTPSLALGVVDTRAEDLEASLRLAARLLSARRRVGLGGLSFICLGERRHCGAIVRDALAALAPDCANWLDGACAFHPALAEGFARRADADEAAKQCAKMNYADGMLHLAEPFARLTVEAPAGFLERFGLGGSDRLGRVDDLSPALDAKHRLFDGILFAMAAPGWLLGCDTLRDCMTHGRLRAFVGHAAYDELMPKGEDARRAAAPCVIRCFERFENPLHKSPILQTCDRLLARFARGVLPLIRAWADENFEPPRLLSFALAATIMLYAGARPDGRGRYAVARGNESQPIIDDPDALGVFARLSHDMDPASLAYAALADRELWDGSDLREIDGLEARVALDIAAIQRDPAYLPIEA